MAEQLVTVKRFLWLAEADLATAALRSYGVQCFLADQYFLLWFPLHAPALGGVKLRVKRPDALDAEEILQWLQKTEVVRCPNCASLNKAADKPFKWLVLGLLLCASVFLPFGILVFLGCLVVGFHLARQGMKWRCKDCGWLWRSRDGGSAASEE